MRLDAQSVALVGVAVTLVLGIYNAIQNYRIGKRTTFINTVTAERIKWIDKLRQSLSTFCGLAHFWRFSTAVRSDDERRVIEEIDKLRHLIVLQLNPDAPLDKEIERLVGHIVSISADHSGVSDEEYRTQLEHLTHKTQRMLKQEWDKVKREAVQGEL